MKITSDHLARGAFIYIRQSTVDQLANNHESKTVLRRIAAGIIPAEQYCKGAPWVIKRRDIEDSHLIECVRHSGHPSSPSSEQKAPDFQ